MGAIAGLGLRDITVAASSIFPVHAPLVEHMRSGVVGGLSDGVRTLGAQGNPALVASAMEFVLEVLHLHRKLNKDKVAGRYQYRG